MRISIGNAREADTSRIVGLMGESFEKERLSYLIYGCPGIKSYVADQINYRANNPVTRYTVARQAGQVIGASEFRLFPNQLFLNYIAVDPQCRSKGLGRLMIADAIRRFRTDQSITIGLDVYEDNSAARRFYERLYFFEIYRTNWFDCQIPDRSSNSFYTVRNWSQAEIIQTKYGFSHFEVTTQERTYSVGRIGARLFRLSGVEWCEDSGLASGLKRLGSKRRILVLAKEPTLNIQGSVLRPFATTIRMETRLDDLMKIL